MDKRKHIINAALCCLILLITSLILLNSTKDYETSHNLSANITEMVTKHDSENSREAEAFVRKFAHLAEFMLLGIAVMCLVQHLKKNYYGGACFYVLSVAVIDEHIQSFSGRTSSTSDIMLDFIGFMIGFSIALLFVWIIKLIKMKKSIE